MGALDAEVTAVDGEGLPAVGVEHVREQRRVGQAAEAGAGDRLGDRGAGGVGVGVAELLGVGAHEVHGQEEAVPVRGRALGAGRHHGVLDLGADGEGRVGRQRPGRGGPGQDVDAGQVRGERRVGAAVGHEGGVRREAGDRERDGDRGVLAHLVDVVVHAQLVVGQRGLVVPAVGQDAEAAVGQALAVQLGEGPDHGLHEVRGEGLVVVLEVDPAGLAGHVVLPLVRVLQDRGAAGVVERVDAHGLDLGLVRHAQLLHRLELGGQAVGVPAEAALHAAALLRLVAGHEVLDVPGEQVAVVRQAVGEGRAVVEDELVLRAVLVPGGTLVDRGLEGAVLVPVRQDAALDLREARGGGGAAVRGGGGEGVHGGPLRPGRRFRARTPEGPTLRPAADAVPPCLPASGGPRGAGRLMTAVTGLPVRFYWGRAARSSGGSPVMAGSTPVPASVVDDAPARGRGPERIRGRCARPPTRRRRAPRGRRPGPRPRGGAPRPRRSP